jgi:hypothetical protein
MIGIVSVSLVSLGSSTLSSYGVLKEYQSSEADDPEYQCQVELLSFNRAEKLSTDELIGNVIGTFSRSSCGTMQGEAPV